MLYGKLKNKDDRPHTLKSHKGRPQQGKQDLVFYKTHVRVPYCTDENR